MGSICAEPQSQVFFFSYVYDRVFVKINEDVVVVGGGWWRGYGRVFWRCPLHFSTLKVFMRENISLLLATDPPPYSSPPSFLRFWNRSKTLTRLEEEFETSDVFRVIYSNNWNLFSSQFIVKYLLSSFPFWITAKMQYDWRKVVELSNKFEER